MDTNALTREQFCQRLAVTSEYHGQNTHVQALLDHDAALRAQLAACQEQVKLEERRANGYLDWINECAKVFDNQSPQQIMAKLKALEQERDRLIDIIRREAWLEMAATQDKQSPYVPWDQYEQMHQRNAELVEALKHIVSWYQNGEVGGTFRGCISIAERALAHATQKL